MGRPDADRGGPPGGGGIGLPEGPRRGRRGSTGAGATGAAARGGASPAGASVAGVLGRGAGALNATGATGRGAGGAGRGAGRICSVSSLAGRLRTTRPCSKGAASWAGRPKESPAEAAAGWKISGRSGGLTGPRAAGRSDSGGATAAAGTRGVADPASACVATSGVASGTLPRPRPGPLGVRGGAESGSGGCTARIIPSRSAFRRARSAWASSIDEEWLFTPMPSDKHRSRASLLVRPSSRASS